MIVKASSNETYLPDLIHGGDDVVVSALDPETDPSLLEVVIEINDQNDSPPRFTSEQFTAGKTCAVLVNN